MDRSPQVKRLYTLAVLLDVLFFALVAGAVILGPLVPWLLGAGLVGCASFPLLLRVTTRGRVGWPVLVAGGAFLSIAVVVLLWFLFTGRL